MYNINSNKWDNEILKKLNIPKSILPQIKNSADNFGITSKKIVGIEIPINAVLGINKLLQWVKFALSLELLKAHMALEHLQL